MTTESSKPPIAPDMKVADFLKYYPDLEKTLIEMSPAFAKLKNPILRKTVAKVASLKQAASVGEITIGELINRLRRAAGIDEIYKSADNISTNKNKKPSWLDKDQIAETLDARPLIEKGDQPITLVVKKLNELDQDRILKLLTPFFPAPLIDKAKAMGYKTWLIKASDKTTETYFMGQNK